MVAYFIDPVTRNRTSEISEAEFGVYKLVIRIDDREEYFLSRMSILRMGNDRKLFDIKLFRKVQGMSVSLRTQDAFSFLKDKPNPIQTKKPFIHPENGSTTDTHRLEQSMQLSWRDIQEAYEEAIDIEGSILLPKRSKKGLQKKVSFSDNEQTSEYKRLKKVKQEESDFCPICYCPCNEISGKPANCIHKFCFHCIEEWTKVTNACPLCKVEFSFIKKFNNGLFEEKVKVEAKKQIHEEEDDSLMRLIENADDYCYFCEGTDNTNFLLICDKCHTKCCHSTCLDPPVEFIPEGDWFCDYCVADHGIRSENPTSNLFARKDIRRGRSRNRARSRTGRQQFRNLGGSRSNSRRSEDSRSEVRANPRPPRRRQIIEEEHETSIVRTRRHYREEENQQRLSSRSEINDRQRGNRKESLEIEMDRLAEEINSVIRERSRTERRTQNRNTRRRGAQTVEPDGLLDDYDTGCFDLNDLLPNRTATYSIRRSTRNRLLNSALNEAYMG